MLPTRGICHGTFLLVHSARMGSRSSLKAWVDDARSMPSHLAAAVDLGRIAEGLFRYGLASVQGAVVTVDRRLAAVGDVATDEVLKAIAAILLEADIPGWLHAATASGRYFPEYIPAQDSDALRWLGEDLEPLLGAVGRLDDGENAFRDWLGAVGESLIVATEKELGAAVRQVSRISDRFGYDIESRTASSRRLEIKTSILGTDHRFFLSRHEADIAKRLQNEWWLIQVILHPNIVTGDRVTAGHVHLIRQISSAALVPVLPADSSHSGWIEAAEVRTVELAWQQYVGTIPPKWEFPGYQPSEILATNTTGLSHARSAPKIHRSFA